LSQRKVFPPPEGDTDALPSVPPWQLTGLTSDAVQLSTLTVKTTSSLTVHPSAVTTVKRRVTDGVVTLTVVVRAFGELMVADPDPGTTLQVVELTLSAGLGVATPVTVKGDPEHWV
jgi:hypothetical protein